MPLTLSTSKPKQQAPELPEALLSQPQDKVFWCRKPLVLNMAGQRGGKSFGIGYRSGNMVREYPAMVGMIAANTYRQLTQSTLVECRRVWKKFYGFTEYDSKSNPKGGYVVNKKPPAHFIRLHEFDSYDGIISFKYGAVIFTASLENYMVHDGKTLGWCELDETKDTKEEAVKQVVLARLSQPGLYYDPEDLPRATLFFEADASKVPAHCIPINPCIINTSPAEGVVDWIVEMFELKTQEEGINSTIFDPAKFYYNELKHKAVCIYSTYWNKHNLPVNYIDNRLDQLTKGEADKFVFGYPFAKTGGEWYSYFDRREHTGIVERLPNYPDHLTFDFNLVPYMTLLHLQIVETELEFQIRVCKEYCYGDPLNTTEAVATGYLEDNTGSITDIFYYGDAMGTRGVEGFGDKVTRFDPVRTVLVYYLTEDSDRTTRANIGVLKRRKMMNDIMAGKQFIGPKKVTLLIDVNCVETIKDMQYTKIGANGKLKEAVKDKATGRTYEKNGHTGDALEYAVCEILAPLID